MPGRQYLDTGCLARLHEVLERTGCSVVVSSSWRHGNSLEWLTELLNVPEGILIGKTPGSGEIFTHDAHGRGTLITMWLAGYGRDVDRWAIVDDDVFDMHPWMLSRLVQTDSNVGLTDENAKELIALLGESGH